MAAEGFPSLECLECVECLFKMPPLAKLGLLGGYCRAQELRVGWHSETQRPKTTAIDLANPGLATGCARGLPEAQSCPKKWPRARPAEGSLPDSNQEAWV